MYMTRFCIAGLINIETTVRVDGFPIPYTPVRYPFFGVRSTVSGVGYNLTKALHTLGHEVDFLSLTGSDAAATLVHDALHADHLPDADVIPALRETPQSVILYDSGGQRQINVDLKDIQEAAYPLDRAEGAIAACDLAVLCNINFARPLIALAKALHKPIATDVHTISTLDDAYNSDFMAAADVLFMSDEHLPAPPEVWARWTLERFPARVVVIGRGSRGTCMGMREGDGSIRVGMYPAVEPPRGIVSTIGAGDALFSAFLHGYISHGDAVRALHSAMVFAAYKIGSAGAADGFLSAAELEAFRA